VVGRVLVIVVTATALTAGLAVILTGPDGALAAAVGGLVALAVLAFGVLALAAVVRILPAASLVVALVTYAAQLAGLLVVFGALSESPAFAEPAVRGWLAGGLVVGTVSWVTAHLVLAVRQRIPVYDLPDPGVSDA
jgi:ATP synthase protein I